MSEADYQAAVAAYLSTRGVTCCPTVCAVPTQATVADADSVPPTATTLRHKKRRGWKEIGPDGPFAISASHLIARSLHRSAKRRRQERETS